MNLTKLQKEIPFDQFSRQYQVHEIINALKVGKKPLKILDVGGYRGHTKDFLTNDQVTIVDLYAVDAQDYVKGSALELPFQDGSFDFVVSFDVLEHIPGKDRTTFVAECTRVAKRGIIICAPNKTQLNVLTEKNLNELYEELHDEPHEWLKEHIEYGLPDFDDITQVSEGLGLITARFYSNKTQLWFAMQQAIFINSKFPIAAESLTQLNEFYNRNFIYDGGGSAATAYRQILCGFKQKKDAVLCNRATMLNEPIDAVLELQLVEKINNFHVTLVTKTSQLAKNYQELNEFNKKQFEDQKAINEQLNLQLIAYEKKESRKLIHKVSAKIRGDKR